MSIKNIWWCTTKSTSPLRFTSINQPHWSTPVIPFPIQPLSRTAHQTKPVRSAKGSPWRALLCWTRSLGGVQLRLRRLEHVGTRSPTATPRKTKGGGFQEIPMWVRVAQSWIQGMWGIGSVYYQFQVKRMEPSEYFQWLWGLTTINGSLLNVVHISSYEFLQG